MHPLVMDAATTDWITAVATALAAPVAAVGVVVAAIQLRGQRRAAEAQLRTTEAEFLLALDDTFRAHRRTHRKFRPPSDTERLPQDDPEGAVGIWWGPRARGPETDGDWVDVEAYMGLFERVNVMINGGLIELENFKPLYGYRIQNILSNDRVVREKLVELGKSWSNFIELALRLGYDVRDPPRRRDRTQ